jgi:NADPH:quinone reductase-like Zn-dependent oxidoreductase
LAARVDDVAVPTPQAGEAVVKIAAAGVNFIDVQHRAGRYKPPALPFTVGSEAAGTVTAVGPGVTEVAVGDRVAYAMVLRAVRREAHVGRVHQPQGCRDAACDADSPSRRAGGLTQRMLRATADGAEAWFKIRSREQCLIRAATPRRAAPARRVVSP